MRWFWIAVYVLVGAGVGLSMAGDRLPSCSGSYPLYRGDFSSIGAVASVVIWPLAAGIAIQRSTHVCTEN